MKVRVSGHFGEWVQGRFGPEGPVALVTVPCHDLTVEAEFMSDGPLELLQSPEVVSLHQARSFLDRIDGRRGVYRMSATMPPGGGAGSSTATLVALAKAANCDTEDLVQACLAVEGASDPLMLPNPDRVLWASREGRILQHLPPLPAAEIVGGFWGPSMVTLPQDDCFADISDLVQSLQAKITLQELADIASISAHRCQALRGPAIDPSEQLAKDLGALGYLRAHTGSARGLIFTPGTAPSLTEDVLRNNGFDHVLRFTTQGHLS